MAINVPSEIVSLALEAISPQNDGWAKQVAVNKLTAIYGYVGHVLGTLELKPGSVDCRCSEL